MLRLTQEEWPEISSSQIVMMDTIPKNRSGKYLPFTFTEHGVIMLASVLKSATARKMNIAIVRAFIGQKKWAIDHSDIIGQLEGLKQRIGEHDIQLNHIYDAIENLLKQKVEQKTWESRERIGFRK